MIEGYNITTTSQKGISISSTTKSFIIRNCYVDTYYYGIYIYGVAGGTATIINNSCWGNNFYGIGFFSSVSSTVAKNTCNNNNQGIYLWSSDSSTIANNTCNNNNNIGIYLWSSDSSTVVNNTCSNNNNNGIKLFNINFCILTYNLLQENEWYGVNLDSDSDNNLIYHNNFVDNNLTGTSQAFDDGLNNTWYDTLTLEGNYWSDWSGTGSYSIDGSAGSVDLYPFDELVEYSTDETRLNFAFTLLISVVTLMLTRTISKKTKKKNESDRLNVF